MKLQSEILIAKKDQAGKWQKVCTGKLYHIGATFPKVKPMTDQEHEQISDCARWIFEEDAKIEFVDLDNGYRVSLFNINK